MGTRGIVLVLTLAAATGMAGCQKKPPPYSLDTKMKALMTDIVDPQAQVFWHSSGAVDTAEGTQNLTPTTPEGWAAAEHAMTAVAEAGNLMMLPGRARDDGDWIKFSKAMTDEALKARAAVQARNGDKMFETGAALYDACQACHQKYLLPYLDANGKPKPLDKDGKPIG